MSALRGLWEERYRKAWLELTRRIATTKGVVVGFHSVVDGLQRINPEWFAPLAADQALVAEVERRAGEVPLDLESPADLVLALLESLRTGKALQRMIRSEALYQWVKDHIGYVRPRLGGTSGNMANSLAPLGLPLVVYAYPLSRPLAELFVPANNLTVLVEEDGEFHFVPPGMAPAADELKALHLIIEYPEGFPVKFGALDFTTPRTNRFIAGWNPTNSQLRINDSFRRGFLAQANHFSHFIISGFHILAERYVDGSTYRECLLPVAELCREAQSRNPELRIHCEFASIASPLIRRGILEWILPAVDSLGLNEVELPTLLEAAGEEALVARLRTGESPAVFLEGARKIMDRTGLKRLHFHNLGYYFVLSRPGYSTPAETREALLLASVLAAARTATGRTGKPEEMVVGLTEPIGEPGLAALASLADYLGDPTFSESGLGTYAGYDFACVPTRLVAKPVLTVGLGDLISSTAFVFDRPLRKE